jgi:hypothetical protein
MGGEGQSASHHNKTKASEMLFLDRKPSLTQLKQSQRRGFISLAPTSPSLVLVGDRGDKCRVCRYVERSAER